MLSSPESSCAEVEDRKSKTISEEIKINITAVKFCCNSGRIRPLQALGDEKMACGSSPSRTWPNRGGTLRQRSTGLDDGPATEIRLDAGVVDFLG